MFLWCAIVNLHACMCIRLQLQMTCNIVPDPWRFDMHWIIWLIVPTWLCGRESNPLKQSTQGFFQSRWGSSKSELRDNFRPSFTLHQTLRVIYVHHVQLPAFEWTKMYSYEYEKIHDAGEESQETLLESNLPTRKSHKCLSLQKVLAIHACILSLYTVLAILAWRLSMRSVSPKNEYGNETYSKPQR